MMATSVPQQQQQHQQQEEIVDPGGGSEEWPSLAASHGQQQQQQQSADGDDWEMLSPNANETSFEGDMVMVKTPSLPSPAPLCRRKSSSVPDLRRFEEQQQQQQQQQSNNTAADEDANSSIVMVPSAATSVNSSAVMVNKPWGKGGTSFKDAILSPSKEPPSSSQQIAGSSKGVSFQTEPSKPKNKVKSRIVVAPIKRCAKSSPDLRSLVNVHEDAGEEGEILGHTDAQEFYARKAHGESSRSNGLKIRPDEAKRKTMIMNKKHAQRQQQK